MSKAQREAAKNSVQRKLFRGFKVYEQGLRTEIYDVLERNQVGRGIHHPGLPNRSSRPYDPPARQSSRLMESIAVLKRATINDLSSEVGPRPAAFAGRFNYASYLEGANQEFGSRRVAPRPYMRPGVKNFVAKFRNAKVV